MVGPSSIVNTAFLSDFAGIPSFLFLMFGGAKFFLRGSAAQFVKLSFSLGSQPLIAP